MKNQENKGNPHKNNENQRKLMKKKRTKQTQGQTMKKQQKQ